MKETAIDYEIVVVGGGISGLTAAAYLGRKGIKTLLLEKNTALGGLIGSFEKNGHVFDWGARAFEDSGILFPMLKQLGLDVEFVHNPVSIGIGKSTVIMRKKEDLDSYLSMLEMHFPDDVSGIHKIGQEIQKVMSYMEVIYGLENPLFLEDYTDREYLMKTLLPWMIRFYKNVGKAEKLKMPINDYLIRFTSNKRLIDMITQHFFKETPAFFALGYFSMYLDYVYPKGGTGVLIKKLSEYLTAHNVDVWMGEMVDQVDPARCTVQTQNGKMIVYKRLIWCADGKALYNVLYTENIKDRKIRKGIDKRKEIIQKSHGGDSVLSFFIGTTLPMDYFAEKTTAHLFYTLQTNGLSAIEPCLPGSFKDGVEWLHTFLENTTYEISIPSLRDPSLSPSGKTSIIVSTLFDYDTFLYLENKVDKETLKTIAGNHVISLLEQHIFPGLAQNVEYMTCTTPRSIQEWSGTHRGAITGWAFDNNGMPSVDRFLKMSRSIYTPIPNILQAGQWTYSPAGVPVCILTGKLAADRIIKERKRGGG